MIIVTGASRGLGLAIAERLAGHGHEILGIARQPGDLPFEAMACDVSVHDDVKAVARLLKERQATVDAVINAAGIASMNLAVFMPETITRRIVETNLLGTIYCCQLLAPLMMRKKRGTIVNFSTIAVALGLKGEAVYAASKAGVETFSKAFAREMADFGIRVNCIAPGPIATDLIKGVGKTQIDRIVGEQVIPRQFEPSDVCDLVELLLDDRAASISGEVLHVGGI
ncbi:3-oxoacyl-[acyl-carrier-protein] reductase FabG [Hartmannibacter diazotrophicus]|uniref:3-oxoacyl-[acyl-carrier-protein] reductase FabG n=1 Tax=Hartmannibacter diazotrophicus TaxID=1482074 RepID=A0A2C9D7J1_9HYPH|nr:SDR family oxidoreductase [Hartmannibacter diazotrophicus]SON56150.1 3-oxoacyl-[acyl-carrier-protein] reductase FabG [Hartmannibacter diazotrophicus]